MQTKRVLALGLFMSILLQGCIETASQPGPATITPTLATPTPAPLIWEPAGLAGQYIRALAVDPKEPKTIYAGGQGLYKSTDGGGSWQPLEVATSVRDIAIAPSSNPRVVYAGSTDGCYKGTTAPVYRSDDGGASWVRIGGNLVSYTIEPTNSLLVYAASCQGILKTTDGGKSWQTLQSSQVLDYEGVTVARGASEPSVLYALYASEGGTVRIGKSTDGGSGWKDVTPKDELWAPLGLAVDPRDSQRAYVSTGKGLWRTDDGGNIWRRLDKGLEAAKASDNGFESYLLSRIIVDPRQPSVLYLGTGGLRDRGVGVFRSKDGGDTWAALGNGLGDRAIRDLAITPGQPSTVYAATSDGVYRLRLP